MVNVPTSSFSPDAADLETLLVAGLDQTVDELRRLVAIPSVSAEPDRSGDVQASAELVAALAAEAGAAQVDVITADGGAPAVLASWPVPAGASEGTPTVLLYAHHDVQPVGEGSAWRSDPFELQEREGRLYGRGAADDKAGVAAHLAAIRALGTPPCGVKLLVEGEEEIGSPTMQALLAEHAQALRADVVVVADSGNPSVDVPGFTATLRGLVQCTVTVRTLAAPQHSGLYGGAVPDALTTLCRLLATLHDEHGDVAIAGLAGGGQAPETGPDDAGLRAEAGVLDGVQLVGTGPIPGRVATKAALSVLAMDAPRVADVANVLLPAASAVLSLRIPPGQDPEQAQDALAAHLYRQVPWGAQVEVERGPTAAPTALTAEGSVLDLARLAFTRAWDGAAPERMGVGGSIPIIAMLAEQYPEATILCVGPGDPASAWHGIDESVSSLVLRRLSLAVALLLDALGR